MPAPIEHAADDRNSHDCPQAQLPNDLVKMVLEEAQEVSGAPGVRFKPRAMERQQGLPSSR